MCAPLKSHPTTKTDDIDKMQLNEPELDQRSYRIRTILLNMQKKTNNIYQWTTFSSLIIFQRLNARHQKRYENCDMIYSDNKPIFIRFVWDEITAKITSCNRNGIETASVRANEQWNFKEFGTRTTTRVNCPINVYIVRRIRYKRHTLQLAFLWKYLSERIHDDHIRKGRNASVQSDCTTISFNKNNKQFASEILLRLLWLCFGLLLSSSFVVFLCFVFNRFTRSLFVGRPFFSEQIMVETGMTSQRWVFVQLSHRNTLPMRRHNKRLSISIGISGEGVFSHKMSLT